MNELRLMTAFASLELDSVQKVLEALEAAGFVPRGHYHDDWSEAFRVARTACKSARRESAPDAD